MFLCYYYHENEKVKEKYQLYIINEGVFLLVANKINKASNQKTQTWNFMGGKKQSVKLTIL